jgi:hypothetical protein
MLLELAQLVTPDRHGHDAVQKMLGEIIGIVVARGSILLLHFLKLASFWQKITRSRVRSKSHHRKRPSFQAAFFRLD